MKYLAKVLLLVIMIFISCTTSRITSSWKAPDAQDKSFKKILVLGLLHENDRSLKEKMEEHVVGDLKNLGYDAICSCEEYGAKTFENMKESEALQKLNGGGIDAVLTIVLLNKAKERYYVQNKRDQSNYSMHNRDWWDYYSTMHDHIYQPGYYTESTKYFWESNFHDLAAKQMLYSVQTESFDPSSKETLAHEYGKLIINDMVKSKILASKTPLAPLKPM